MEDEEQQFYGFDDLIIEEILVRLPVKSLIRFKSVSKKWYSIISCSKFAISQFIKSPFSHPSASVNTLFIQCGNNYYLFTYDDNQISGNFEDNLVKLDVPFDHANKYPPVLRGYCNGLICLSPKYGDYFIIWNPATRKMHKYKSHGYLFNHDIATGFGYVSSVDDYKYVQIFEVPYGEDRGESVVYIFSVTENKWRKIDFREYLICVHGEAVLVNEKLYWKGADYENGGSTCIVSFDLEVERYDIIKLNRLIFLGVMEGRLSGCTYNRTYWPDDDKFIHILEPHGIVKSIDVPKEELKLNVYSQILGSTRTGKLLVTTKPPEEEEEAEEEVEAQVLGIVDTSTKPIQYTTLLRFQELVKIARYVPSLHSPFLNEERSEA